jgi:hypothetical protein
VEKKFKNSIVFCRLPYLWREISFSKKREESKILLIYYIYSLREWEENNNNKISQKSN